MADVKWNREQNIAIHARAKDILVAAAAGSGKTAVMVERVVRLILSGVPLEKMLIVTFTNASTAEMKSRIRKALKNGIEKSDDPEERRIFREQLDSLATADISNFHGFAMKIINQFFHKLPDLEPGYRVEDELKIRAISGNVVDELFYDYFNSQDEKHQRFLAFLDDYSNGRTFGDIKNKIIALHGEIRNIPRYEDVVSRMVDDYRGIENQDDLDAYLRSKEKISKYYENIIEENNSKAKKSKKKAEENEDNKEELFKPTLNALKQAAFIMELVLDFDERFRLAKKDAGVIDFSDIEHFAIKLLDEESVADFYSKKFEYIFVDEYQDTSALQEYFIEKISKKSSLFMVGDIKQSIYRFRNAEPQIFQDKYDRFTPEKDALLAAACEAQTAENFGVAATSVVEVCSGEDAQANVPDEVELPNGGFDFKDQSIRIDLSANYRSKKYILDAVNNLFRGRMDGYNEESELKIGAPNPENAIHEPTYHFVNVERNEEANRDELEAVLIAKIIKDHLGQEYFVEGYEEDPNTGETVKTSKRKTLEYRDMVILSRAVSGYGTNLAKNLVELGIPAYVTKKSDFFEAIEIRIFLRLLEVVENRLSDIALLALLKSEIYGFTDEELARIALKNEEHFYLNMISYIKSGEQEDLTEKIRRFDGQIERFRTLAIEESLDEFLWHLMQETNYYMMAGAMPLGDVRQANLQYLIELALDYEERGNVGLSGYLDMLNRIKIDENLNMDEADVTGEGANAVKIASIHWSKGLEFPMVILTGYNRKMNRTSYNWSFHKDIGLALKAINPKKVKPDDTILTRLIKNIKDNEEDEESMRALYVALTRAKDFLYVVGVQPKMNYKSLSTLVEWNGKRQDYVVDDILAFEQEIREDYEKTREGTKHSAENRGDGEIFDESVFEDVRRKLEYLYPYKESSKIKPKYTATEINKWRSDDDDFFEFFCGPTDLVEPDITERTHLLKSGSTEKVPLVESGSAKKMPGEEQLAEPRFLAADQVATAAWRGSIYHKILEMCDYIAAVNTGESNEYLNELVADMVKKEIINADELKEINLEKIKRFFESDLAKRMAAAEEKEQLYKEKQFIYMTTPNDEIFRSAKGESYEASDKAELQDKVKLPDKTELLDKAKLSAKAKMLDKAELPEENVIVQGIIDAFFIEENEAGEKYFVLVDFKTNRIDERHRESELERLKELYRGQMLTYEKALKYSNFLGEGGGQPGAEPKIEKIIYHMGTNLCIKY